MLDSNLSICEMTCADIREVVKLWMETPNICFSTNSSYESVVRRYLERNPRLSFIVRDNKTSKVVGTLLAGTDGMYGTMRHAVVVEGYRGLGIMHALQLAVFKGFQTYQINECFVYVLDSNDIGLEYYKKNGWQQVDGVTLLRSNMHI